MNQDLFGEIVKKLTDPVDINNFCKTSKESLEFCRYYKKSVMKRVLKAHSVSFSDGTLSELYTRLFNVYTVKRAIIVGDFDTLKQHTRHLHFQDPEGNNALHFSVLNGDLRVFKFIASHLHSKLNRQNKNGDTALHIAVRNKKDDFAIHLLNNDADYMSNNKGESVVHIASRTGNTRVMKVILDDPHSPVDVLNNNGKSPIDIAKDHNNWDILELLEDY